MLYLAGIEEVSANIQHQTTPFVLRFIPLATSANLGQGETQKIAKVQADVSSKQLISTCGKRHSPDSPATNIAMWFLKTQFQLAKNKNRLESKAVEESWGHWRDRGLNHQFAPPDIHWERYHFENRKWTGELRELYMAHSSPRKYCAISTPTGFSYADE